MTARVLTLLALAFLADATQGCARSLSLENRSCPCIQGYECCKATNTCVPRAATCPSINAGSGGGGAGSLATAGASSGVGGSVGSGADAGAPPGHWQPLGQVGLPELDNWAITGFELGPDGSPFLALTICTECPALLAGKFMVLRYADGVWTELGAEGLPPAVFSSAEFNPVTTLRVFEDGTPHLIFRDVAVSYIGGAWQQRLPILPDEQPLGRDFERGADGRFYVTSWEDASSTVSVATASFDADGWARVGDGWVDAFSVTLAVRESMVCVGYEIPDPMHIESVSCLDGEQWQSVGDTRPLSLAIAPDGTLYAAFLPFESTEMRVLRRRDGAWTDLPARPQGEVILRVAVDGTLFAAIFPDGRPPSITSWNEESSAWIELGAEGLGTATYALRELEVTMEGTKAVPYLVYGAKGGELLLMKYE